MKINEKLGRRNANLNGRIMRSFDERVVTWKKFSRFLLDTSSPKQPLQNIDAFWRVLIQSWLLKKNPGKQITQIHVLTLLKLEGCELWNKANKTQKTVSPEDPHAAFQLWFTVFAASRHWPAAGVKKGSPQNNLLYARCHRAQGDSTIIQNKWSTGHVPIIQNKQPRVT